MEQNRLRWLVGGIFLLALAGYNFATYTVNSSQQSSFNILSGKYEYLSRSENPGNTISGSFQEASASLISYYIMNSAQFSAFQIGTSLGAVYFIEDVPSASISYGFTTQDDYYFVFRHGTGLLNSTETVTYQRTYTSHDSFRLDLAILFLVFGAVELVVGFRPRKAPKPSVPLPIGQPAPSTFGTLTQSSTRVCKTCGQFVAESATFCPSCGTKLTA